MILKRLILVAPANSNPLDSRCIHQSRWYQTRKQFNLCDLWDS